jgi:UDP-N-acetylglucosamine 2-epimerase
VIYPNADAGGRGMIEMINEYKDLPFITIYKCLEHIDYLSLLKKTSVLIGNSSSGIVEAPSFGIPVLNIGSRQQGRQRADNVIDVGYNKLDIVKGIHFVLHDEEFKRRVKKKNNPYGDGHSGKKIVEILNNLPIDNTLLQKKSTNTVNIPVN